MMLFRERFHDAISPLMVHANMFKMAGPAGNEVDLQIEDMLEEEALDVAKYAGLGRAHRRQGVRNL